MGFPPVPPEIKPVAHLMKLADEHQDRNIVVTYWARMSACLLALKMTPGKKTPETAALIGQLLDWLEATKKENKDNDAISSEAAAQAVIEEYALNIFSHADKQDRAEIFNKNTVKAFYTAGILFDVLEQFGVLSEELHEKQKYAKWKAAFIHNCLKSGEKPFSGAPGEQNKMLHISELPEEEQKMLEDQRRKEEEDEIKRATAGSITPGVGYPGSVYPSNPAPTFPAGPSVSNPTDPAASFPAGPSNDFPTFPSFPSVDSNNGVGNNMPGYSPVSPMVPQQPGSVTPVAPTVSTPAVQPTTYNLPSPTGGSQVTLSPELIQKAQKYSKYATSALTYDDVKTAILNLQKALNLLQLGKES